MIPQADAAGLSRQGRKLFWDDRPIQLVGYSYYGLLADRSFDADSAEYLMKKHIQNGYREATQEFGDRTT